MNTKGMAEYSEKLRDAHFGELVGESLFREMAILFPQKAASFQALSEVEHLVGNILGELLERYHVAPVEEAQVSMLTSALLADASLDDWDRWLHRFREVLKPFVMKFDDLHTYGPTSDARELLLLRDHERMLLEFVEQEISGQEGLPIIKAFLESASLAKG